MHIRAPALVLGLTALLGSAGLAPAQSMPITIQPGSDFQATVNGAFADLSVPADFFGPGSDPFQAVVAMRGENLRLRDANGMNPNPDAFFSIDTVLERLDQVTLPAVGDRGQTRLVFRALELASIDPITVTFNGGQNPQPWDVWVCAAPDQTLGTMDIQRDCEHGGTFTVDLFLTPLFRFAPAGAVPTVLELEGPTIKFESTGGCWSDQVDPNAVFLGGLLPPSASSQFRVEMDPICGTSQFFAPTSNFFAGVMPADCNMTGMGTGLGEEPCIAMHCSGKDKHPTTCPSAECYLMMGLQKANLSLGGSAVLLLQPLILTTVSMTRVPTFQIPNDPAIRGASVLFQVYMHNEMVFPRSPTRLSNGLDVVLGGAAQSYGAASGLQLWAPQPAQLGGPFTVAFSF